VGLQTPGARRRRGRGPATAAALPALRLFRMHLWRPVDRALSIRNPVPVLSIAAMGAHHVTWCRIPKPCINGGKAQSDPSLSGLDKLRLTSSSPASGSSGLRNITAPPLSTFMRCLPKNSKASSAISIYTSPPSAGPGRPPNLAHTFCNKRSSLWPNVLPWTRDKRQRQAAEHPLGASSFSGRSPPGGTRITGASFRLPRGQEGNGGETRSQRAAMRRTGDGRKGAFYNTQRIPGRAQPSPQHLRNVAECAYSMEPIGAAR
jgi:hypothetical protein